MHPDPHVRMNRLTGQTMIIKISLIIGKLLPWSEIRISNRTSGMTEWCWLNENLKSNLWMLFPQNDAVIVPSRSMMRYFQVINSRQWVKTTGSKICDDSIHSCFFPLSILLQLWQKENTVAYRLNRHWNQMARSWKFFKYTQISKGTRPIGIRLMSAWNPV